MEHLTEYESEEDELPFDTLSVKEQTKNKQNVTSFFNLEDSSSSEDESTINPRKFEGFCEATTPHSGLDTIKTEEINDVNDYFWKNNTSETNWEQPDKIWSAAETKTTKREINLEKHKSDSQIYSDFIPKKSKITLCRSDSGLSSESNDCKTCIQEQRKTVTKKSFYYIHHKISPFLNLAEKNKITRKLPKKSVDNLVEHTGAVNRVKWSVPQYSHLLLSAGIDKTVRIWNVFSDVNKCVQTISLHSKAVRDACWSYRGKEILSGSYDKTAIVTDAETGKLIVTCEHDGYVSAVKYHPVNYNYIMCGTTNKLICWDTRNTVKPVRTFTHNHAFGQVNDLVFLRNGTEFFSCNDIVNRSSSDCNVMAWDFKTGVVLSNQIYQERYTCTRLIVHPFDNKFFAQTQGNYIAAFSTVRPYKMNKFKRYDGHKVIGYNVGCDINQDGNVIASGSSDGQINFYDQYTARKIHQLNLAGNSICLDVAFHPVLNSTLAISTWNGNVHILQ